MTGEDRTTPRPWEMFYDSYDDGTMFLSATTPMPGAPGGRVIDGSPIAESITTGNAHLIVEAVNNYDRLRAIEEAARAAMDVADSYVDETETSPLWDDIPVELADKLVALRAALEGAPHDQ